MVFNKEQYDLMNKILVNNNFDSSSEMFDNTRITKDVYTKLCHIKTNYQNFEGDTRYFIINIYNFLYASSNNLKEDYTELLNNTDASQLIIAINTYNKVNFAKIVSTTLSDKLKFKVIQNDDLSIDIYVKGMIVNNCIYSQLICGDRECLEFYSNTFWKNSKTGSELDKLKNIEVFYSNLNIKKRINDLESECKSLKNELTEIKKLLNK